MLKVMQRYLPRFELILFWLLNFSLAFIILYPKRPLLNIEGTFVAIRIEDFLIFINYLLWVIYLGVFGKWRELIRDRLIQAMLVFFVVGAVSTFSAIFLTHTASFNLGVLHYFRRVEFMLFLPLVLTLVNTRKKTKTVLITLMGVLLLVNIYALGQQYLGWVVISTTNSEFSKGQILKLTPGGRVNSTFAGHYDLAIFLMMMLTLLSALIFTYRKILFVGFQGILLVLSFFILVLTAARFSFVGAVVGIIGALYLTGKKKFILGIIILAVVAALYPSHLRDRLLSTLTINIWQSGERYQEGTMSARPQLNIYTLPIGQSSPSAEATASATRSAALASDIAPGEPTNTTELGVYRSLRIRLLVEWPRAINAFLKNPILGTGYSSLGLATDNDFLRSLGEVGVLGTLSFILILYEVIKRFIRMLKTNDKLQKYMAAGLLAMIAAFVTNGLFIDVFEASKVAIVFWTLVGLGLTFRGFEK